MRRIEIAGLALVVALGMIAATAGSASAVLTLEDGTGGGQGVPIEIGESFTMEARASFDFGSYNVVCNEGGYSGFVAKNKKATDELRFVGPLHQFRELGEYGEGYCGVNGGPFPTMPTADVLSLTPLSLRVGAKGVATLKATESKELEFSFAMPSLSAIPFSFCYYGAAKFKGHNNATAVSPSEPTGRLLEAEFIEQPMKLGYVDPDSPPGSCPKKMDANMKVLFGLTGKGKLISEHT